MACLQHLQLTARSQHVMMTRLVNQARIFIRFSCYWLRQTLQLKECHRSYNVTERGENSATPPSFYSILVTTDGAYIVRYQAPAILAPRFVGLQRVGMRSCDSGKEINPNSMRFTVPKLLYPLFRWCNYAIINIQRIVKHHLYINSFSRLLQSRLHFYTAHCLSLHQLLFCFLLLIIHHLPMSHD